MCEEVFHVLRQILLCTKELHNVFLMVKKLLWVFLEDYQKLLCHAPEDDKVVVTVVIGPQRYSYQNMCILGNVYCITLTIH